MENYYRIEEVFNGEYFWDIYRDVNGVKPRRHRFYLKSTTDAERAEMVKALGRDFEAQQEQYRLRRIDETKKLNEEIDALVDYGRVSSRAEAIRFLFHEGDYQDATHFIYSFNLENTLESECFQAINGVVQ